MDIALVIIAALLVIIGMFGSFLPVLPGVPLSWIGLLMLHLTDPVPVNYIFLGITLVVTLLMIILQYAIPALGSRYFGGSKKGMVGATIGLIVGIFIPIPFGIILGAFGGAFIGEVLNKSESRTAIRAAFGSFVGLLTSTFMEFLVTAIFFILFCVKVWNYRESLLNL